jgi:hypothetical protein
MPKRGNYTHVQALEKEILEMLNSGKTQREVAEHYGFRNKNVVKKLVERYHRRQRDLEVGILPRRRGRPSKNNQQTDADKDGEIKQLRMENELLRDFLQIAGRK